MKAISFLLLGIGVLVISSCRTQNVITDTKREINLKVDSTIVVNDNSTIKLNTIKLDTSSKKDVISEIVEEYEYSVPDTTGKQFVVKIQRTQRTIRSDVKLGKVEKLDSLAQAHLEKKTKVNKKTKENFNEKITQKRFIKVPIQVVGLVIIVIGMILIWLKMKLWK